MFTTVVQHIGFLSSITNPLISKLSKSYNHLHHTPFLEGCGRTPAKPAPPPTTTPSYVNSTVPENHRLACTENETQQKACLHGGTCLASVLDNYRTISCQ
jgi:hypothetical protein